jgi:hypothetical protein
MFEFALKTFFIKNEERKDRKSTKSSKGSGKGVGGGAGRGSSSVAHPTGSAVSPRVAGASSSRGITCRVLEFKRHTVSVYMLPTYQRVGQNSDKREEKRQKLVWLQGDAQAHGFQEWVTTYKEAVKALPAVTPSVGGQSGKGSSNRGGWHGRGRGRGGAP